MTTAPRVRFDRVSLSYASERGALQVLDDVSYGIDEGDFVAIIGPSGCGKTTMMNMLAGFLKPTSGQVLLDGEPVEGPGPERGVIFQEYGVFPWLSVKDNIAFGLRLKASRRNAREIDEICARYMRLMGLSDFANAFPKTLSGGMRQRLAIARAYAVLEALATERKTVMLITHSVEEAIYLASRIIVVTARPARVREIIDVPFGYPRSEGLHEEKLFGELRSHIRDVVMREYRAQQQQGTPAAG